MTIRKAKYVLLALVAASAGSSTAVAARQTAVIEGSIHEARTGTTVAGITVQLTRNGAATRSVESDRSGAFRFDQVVPGSYVLVVHSAGYEAAEREITIESGGRMTLRLDLTPMLSALDTLRVFASPLSLRRDRTEFGARIEERALRLLPTPYEPVAAASLTPGVSGDRIWGGAAREANLYQVDGLAVTHPGVGGMLIPLSPSWVEALEVRGLGAGAELGNFQGGIVNVVTRSGTARWLTSVQSSIEDAGMNASNVVDGEIGRERAARREVEAEVGGPLREGRLFMFAAGHYLRDDSRAQSRLPAVEDRYLPQREQKTELRGFGKLTWIPTARDRVDATVALGRATGENWGLDGYQADNAAPDYSSPSRLLMLSWLHGGDGAGSFEVRAVEATAREEWSPVGGQRLPAVRTFAFGDPPTPVYRNAPFEIEREPVTRTVSASWSTTLGTGWYAQNVLVGGELTRGSWLDRRSRSGGVTWRPARTNAFDPALPSTWFSGMLLPSDWGGEVDLHARTASEALFVQDRIDIHPRITLTPGIRWGAWRGDLLPGGREADRFRAIDVSAWEPRLGVIVDPFGREDLLIKAHWGRYHQNVLASFFDRAQGGDVFSNRELWYYRGTPFTDPGTTFTPSQRDAMSTGSPRFTLEEIIRLNETGPVSPDYRQPHVDQLLVGIEKTVGDRIRLEGLYINRRNRNLVALIDRNIDSNYHRWENVTVTTPNGAALEFGDGPLVLPAVYIPNDAIRRQLAAIADGAGLPLPPGFQLSDTLTLTFEQDFELDNVPGAFRDLSQVQLSMNVSYPTWGGSASLVLSRLEGNLNAVTGYEPGTGYERFWELGAGPYVRPNEQINFEGDLPGVNPYEIKLAAHGELPLGLRGGAFLLVTRGEAFTPYFTLTGLTNRFFLSDGSEIGNSMVQDVAGQRVFARRRGDARYADHASLDLRVEKELPVAAGVWRATLDVFNVWNTATVNRINASLTYPSATSGSAFRAVDSSAIFGSIWGRVPPRTIRLGLTASF